MAVAWYAETLELTVQHAEGLVATAVLETLGCEIVIVVVAAAESYVVTVWEKLKRSEVVDNL